MKAMRRQAAGIVMGVALLHAAPGIAPAGALCTSFSDASNRRAALPVHIATPWETITGHVIGLAGRGKRKTGRFTVRLPVRPIADTNLLSVFPGRAVLTGPENARLTLTGFEILDAGAPVRRAHETYLKDVIVTATATSSGPLPCGGWKGSFVVLENSP